MHNRMLELNLSVWWLVILSCLGLATPAAGQMLVTVDGTQVDVGPVTPGGRVAMVGVEFQKPPWRWRIVPLVQTVRDEDGDGQVTVPLPGKQGRAAVVAAVDISSGMEAVTSWKIPGGEVPELKSRWVEADQGEAPALQLSSRGAVVLMVAANGVMASATVFDGSDLDADGKLDGAVRINAASLQPLEDTEPGGVMTWGPGDRVYAVDLDRLGYAGTEVPRAGTGTAGGEQ